MTKKEKFFVNIFNFKKLINSFIWFQSIEIYFKKMIFLS